MTTNNIINSKRVQLTFIKLNFAICLSAFLKGILTGGGITGKGIFISVFRPTIFTTITILQ